MRSTGYCASASAAVLSCLLVAPIATATADEPAPPNNRSESVLLVLTFQPPIDVDMLAAQLVEQNNRGG